MERTPEIRKDEQYPLLKVATGITDAVRPPPPALNQSWNVTCSQKPSWVNRWPEIVSVSWMTLILLAMSFLVFYTLNMGAYRTPALLIKYNEVQPSSNVFFHNIVHRGSQLPFALYTHFLHCMALSYPKLRFNVIFLIDDAMRTTYLIPRHARLLGFHSKDARDEVAKQEMQELEKKHPNVNITMMDLNKFMAMTPLRYKWRSIPASYLSFYTRIFSVWQNGGIGMDLNTFNNQFCNKVRMDRRITEILKNHNEGLPIEDYKVMLRAIDEEEENSFKSLEQMWNDTLSIFNNIFSFGFGPSSQILDMPPLDITPQIKKQRKTRDVNNNFYEILTPEVAPNTDNNVVIEVKTNETVDDKVNNTTEINSSNDQLKTAMPQITSEQSNLTSSITTLKVDDLEAKRNITVGFNKSSNNPERLPAVMFYDFSIMSDNVGRGLSRVPLWESLWPQSFGFRLNNAPVKDVDKKKNSAAHVALASNGDFVAATDKLHPLLGMLITAGFQRMRPEFAIQDTILTQCSGMFKNEAFCNIYEL